MEFLRIWDYYFRFDISSLVWTSAWIFLLFTTPQLQSGIQMFDRGWQVMQESLNMASIKEEIFTHKNSCVTLNKNFIYYYISPKQIKRYQVNTHLTSVLTSFFLLIYNAVCFKMHLENYVILRTQAFYFAAGDSKMFSFHIF